MAEKPILIDYNFGGTAKITGLPTPVAISDAAPKSYVDVQDSKGLGKIVARFSRANIGI